MVLKWVCEVNLLALPKRDFRTTQVPYLVQEGQNKQCLQGPDIVLDSQVGWALPHHQIFVFNRRFVTHMNTHSFGGQSPPHKKCQIIKWRGKAILIFSLWLRINGGRFFSLKGQGLCSVKLLAWSVVLIPFPSRRGYYCQTTCIACGACWKGIPIIRCDGR